MIFHISCSADGSNQAISRLESRNQHLSERHLAGDIVTTLSTTYLLVELVGGDLDVAGADGAHVRTHVVERHAPRPDRVLVLVRVYACGELLLISGFSCDKHVYNNTTK